MALAAMAAHVKCRESAQTLVHCYTAAAPVAHGRATNEGRGDVHRNNDPGLARQTLGALMMEAQDGCLRNSPRRRIA